MATSKRYVPPLSKSKGSAGAAAESTRRLDDLVQDSIFTVKLGSKNNYSESKSEKVILQYCYCFTVYINNFDKSQYAVCTCVIILYSNFNFKKSITRNCLHFHEGEQRYSCSLSCYYPSLYFFSALRINVIIDNCYEPFCLWSLTVNSGHPVKEYLIVMKEIIIKRVFFLNAIEIIVQLT